MKKVILITVGIISAIIGVIGIIVPLLPTTPLLIITAICFMHGSPKIYNWLMDHTPMGNYINSYLTYHAIPLKSKIKSVIFLWIVMIPAIIFSSDELWFRILLAVIGTGVSTHLLTLKTLTAELIDEIDVKRASEEQESTD